MQTKVLSDIAARLFGVVMEEPQLAGLKLQFFPVAQYCLSDPLKYYTSWGFDASPFRQATTQRPVAPLPAVYSNPTPIAKCQIPNA